MSLEKKRDEREGNKMNEKGRRVLFGSYVKLIAVVKEVILNVFTFLRALLSVRKVAGY